MTPAGAAVTKAPKALCLTCIRPGGLMAALARWLAIYDEVPPR